MSLLRYLLFSPLQVAQHVSGNYVPIFRSRVVFSPRVGIVPCLQEGCQNLLAGSVSIEEFVAQSATNFVPSCSYGTKPTRGENTTHSSAPEDGHMVARNMLSNL